MKTILTLQEILDAVGGDIVQGDPSSLGVNFQGINTDSRKIRPGEMFIPIRGGYFDGHWFVDEVFKAGALGAFLEPTVIVFEMPAISKEFLIVRVPSTLRALHAIAAAHRARLPMKTIGVTGSNGKTSTKEFAAAALGQRFKVVKNSGNLNNHIGVPLSLFEAQPEHEFGVFEAGMNHRGEIAPLAAMMSPDIAIITNIGVAHIENLGSRDEIFEEKADLVRALKQDGTLIYDVEDDFAARMAELPAAKKITIGFHAGDVRASNPQPSISGVRFELILPSGTAQVYMTCPGIHMVRNALLGAAAAYTAGLDAATIASGLSSVSLPSHRLEILQVRGATIIDDTYNANPDSAKAAIETLKHLAGTARKIIVFGDMGELGHFAEEGHRSVGAAAAEIDILLTVGELSAWAADEASKNNVGFIQHVALPEEAAHILAPMLQPGDFILVKGSRAAQMERFIEALSN